MTKFLIVGATSAIATACARQWTTKESQFFLVGRNTERLKQVAQDLTVRGAHTVSWHSLDIDDYSAHSAMLEQCARELGVPDIVLVAPGTLPDQAVCQTDTATAVREFTTNATSVIALLTPIASMLEAHRSGVLAVISSVAGDRGRPSNYLYGSAKAALSTFCSGLNARLFKSGVHVLTIKPGFVATPMTEGLPLPGPLVASPDKVARDIARAVEKRKNVLYTPWFWSLIMLIIKAIPAPLFKRKSL